MTFGLWYKSNHDFCAFAARNRAEFGKCRNKKGMQMKQKRKNNGNICLRSNSRGEADPILKLAKLRTKNTKA